VSVARQGSPHSDRSGPLALAVCLVEPALHLRDTPGQNPAWSSDQLA
jgi:hypothetical protein